MFVEYRRPDGTYVINLNGFPYHVTESNALFSMEVRDALPLRAEHSHQWNGTAFVEVAPEPGDADVDMERARRIAEGKDVIVTGLSSSPVALQMRPDDQVNLLGLAQEAQLRKALGNTAPFNFRDRLNVVHVMTADQMLEFALQAGAFKSAVIEASWALKSPNETPADYDDDARWPA